jgi:ribosomal protein L7/L12
VSTAAASTVLPLTAYTAVRFSAQLPAGWNNEEAESNEGSYVESKWRNPSAPSDSMLVDVSPASNVSSDQMAAPVHAALQSETGYQEISYGPGDLSQVAPDQRFCTACGAPTAPSLSPTPPTALDHVPLTATDDMAGRGCPYCRLPLKAGGPVIECQQCHSVHHEDCYLENRGCAVAGCAGGPASHIPSTVIPGAAAPPAAAVPTFLAPRDQLVIIGIDPSRRAAAAAVVRDATGLAQQEAETIIDTQELIECFDDAEARSLKAELERVGATVAYATRAENVSGEEEPSDALVITGIDPSRRAAAAAVVRDATGLAQQEAETIIDTQELIECFDDAEARSLKAELERVGATVEASGHGSPRGSGQSSGSSGAISEPRLYDQRFRAARATLLTLSFVVLAGPLLPWYGFYGLHDSLWGDHTGPAVIITVSGVASAIICLVSFFRTPNDSANLSPVTSGFTMLAVGIATLLTFTQLSPPVSGESLYWGAIMTLLVLLTACGSAVALWRAATDAGLARAESVPTRPGIVDPRPSLAAAVADARAAGTAAPRFEAEPTRDAPTVPRLFSKQHASAGTADSGSILCHRDSRAKRFGKSCPLRTGGPSVSSAPATTAPRRSTTTFGSF